MAQSDLEKYQKAADDLRDLVREAHGATKDLNAAYKACKAIFDGFEEMCQREYASQFQQLGAAIDVHLREADTLISQRFDQVRREIFEPNETGTGAPSLGDLMTAKRVIDSVLTTIAVNAIGGEAVVQKMARNLALKISTTGAVEGMTFDIAPDPGMDLGDMRVRFGGGEDSSG